MDESKYLGRREFTVQSALAILSGVAITVSACDGNAGNPTSPSTMPGGTRVEHFQPCRGTRGTKVDHRQPCRRT